MYTNKMYLEDTIIDHLPVQHAAQYPDAYGIEVELEGKNFTNPPGEVLLYWASVKDGSLRIKLPGDCALEYITRQPFPMPHIEKAITALFTYLTSPGVK